MRSTLEGQAGADRSCIIKAIVLGVLHDPVVVYLIIIVCSSGVAWLMFRVLKSKASIKVKQWSAEGAIAAFIIVALGSWNALRPELQLQKSIEPLSVPGGFKKISNASAGLAFAIPNDWHLDPQKSVTMNASKATSVDDVAILNITTTPCTQLSFDIDKLRSGLSKMIGMFVFHGESRDEPINGRQSLVIDVTETLPKELLNAQGAKEIKKDVALNLLMRQIYDVENGRCINVVYPNDEIGRKIMSTINIQAPQ